MNVSATVYDLNPPNAVGFNPRRFSCHRCAIASHLVGFKGSYHLKADNCFAGMLVDLLADRAGQVFTLSPPGSSWTKFTAHDPWSEVVNDLLEPSFSSAVRVLRNEGFYDGQRRQDHLLSSLTSAGKPMFFLHFTNESQTKSLDWLDGNQTILRDGWWEPQLPRRGFPMGTNSILRRRTAESVASSLKSMMRTN